MAKKKSSAVQGGSKGKNAAKGKEKKSNRPDGDFEKLLEEVEKPKKCADKETHEKKESKKEDKKQVAVEAKSNEVDKNTDEEEDDDESDSNFSFVSMFIAIIAFVLAVKILLNYNDLSSKNRILQDRVESIDEAIDRNNSALEKKIEEVVAKTSVKEVKKPEEKKKDDKYAKKIAEVEKKLVASESRVVSYKEKLDHLEKIVFTSNNFQAALELKSALDRLDDLSTWVTGDSKKKVDDVRIKIIDLITSLEHGSDTWQPMVFPKVKAKAPSVFRKRRPVRKPPVSRKVLKPVSKRVPPVHRAPKKLVKPVSSAHKVPKKLVKPVPAHPVPVDIKRIKKSGAIPIVKKKKVSRVVPKRSVPARGVHPGVVKAPPIPVRTHGKLPPKAKVIKSVKPSSSVKSKKVLKKSSTLDDLLSSKSKGKDDSFESLFEGYGKRGKKGEKEDDDLLDF